MKKFLIVRFSSIGDIVLTSPIIRSLATAHPEAEIHFLTKPSFSPLVEHHPNVSKVHVLPDNWADLIRILKEQKFDHVLDLHNNLRTRRLALSLRVPVSRFPKMNWQKYWMVRRNRIPASPLPHIVERYGKVLSAVGAKLDDHGLDIFYPAELNQWAMTMLQEMESTPLAVVLGATYRTKRWITSYFLETLNQLNRPVVLLGGRDAIAERDELMEDLTVPVFDAVNRFSLLEATALLDQCEEVLTHDTGFMHIAAALGKRIYSIWGNTVPAFGMTPYKTESVIFENNDLDCRPCSKIGFDECPKGHFRCMMEIRPEEVVSRIQESRIQQTDA